MAKKNLKKDFEKKHFSLGLSVETKKKISGVVLVVLALILILSFFGLAGQAGNFLKGTFTFLIGKVAFLTPFLFLFLAFLFFKTERKRVYLPILIGVLFFILAISALLALIWPEEKFGGILGYLISQPVFNLFDFWASLVIFLAFGLIGLLIFGQFLLPKREKPIEEKPSLFKKIFLPKFKVKEIPPVIEEEKVLSKEAEKVSVSFPPELKVKPIEKEILAYQPPPFNFLESDSGQPSAGDIKENSAIIKRTLQNFDIPVQMGQVNIGPTVTQYTLKPAEGVKLSKITALSNDLALALAAHPIRIEAPIPGKSLVGIEVPNKVRTLVRLRDLISLSQFQNAPSNLTLALGRDVSGNPVYADLAKMPHLLVAGSTGTGKTCAANTLMFTENGLLTFEELCPLPLNSEADFKVKLITRDGIETTEKIYNNGICQFYKLSTARGYQIEATAEHPLWVINEDGSQSWKPASLIKKGDYIAINREPALFGSKTILDFKPSRIWGNTKRISFPSRMTPQLAQFLGLLTADGYLSVEKKGTHRVVYSQANPKLLSLYKRLLKELFGITQFIEKRSGSNPKNKAKDIVVNSKQLKEFLTFLGMKSVKASQKEIPRAIRESPKEIVASYLQALFDNDGYSGEKTHVELSLSSKKLLSQVQIMLLNFGIISSLKNKKVKKYPQNEYFRLSIYGEDGRKFIKEIGFFRKEKYQKVKKFLKLSPNPNVDLIPNVSYLFKTLGQKYLNRFARLKNQGWIYQPGISVPKYAFSSLKSYNSGERKSSYQALKKILDFYQPIAQEVEYQELIKIAQRNFYWDKVEKIERTSGVGYDFYVPGSDSFVGNGFVNHNTIFLNSLILSLLYRNSPEILRFILIDPKRVEFSVYSNLPHLLAPIIFDPKGAVAALRWLIMEMERRFEIFLAQKVRDIISYNEEIQKRKKEIENNLMPYIILIIDELADLMAARGREIEAGIVRLAQMARAVGIHLVVATQRPSVEVVTGLIKANITSRIAFQVASQIDSRTVFDMAGAEKLLGSGDMLYIGAEIAKPKRIQAAYVSEKEIKRVVSWLASKTEKLERLELEELEKAIPQDLEKKEEFSTFADQEDPLYEEAKRLVIEAKKASASFLQRRLRIGYARAARLIDMLEERGVVGPGEGAKPREVYLENDQ